MRTKTATEELAEELTKAGFPAAALHGDIVQQQRERIVDKLKSGELDIVIATDVVRITSYNVCYTKLLRTLGNGRFQHSNKRLKAAFKIT